MKYIIFLLALIPGMALSQCLYCVPKAAPAFSIPLFSIPPLNILSRWATFGGTGSGDGKINGVIGVAVVPVSGNVVVADKNNNRMQIFDKNGVYLSQFSRPNAYATKVDSSGNIYVSWAAGVGSGYIYKYGPSPTYSALLTIGSGAGSGDGQFYVNNGCVDFAIDSNGNIYACDNLGERIQKFNSLGVFQWTSGSLGTGDGQFGGTSFGMEGPRGIAIYNDLLYVVDDDNGRVQLFDFDGVYQSQFPIPITVVPFHTVIAINQSSGNVYVAGRSGGTPGTSEVAVFNSTGTFLYWIGSAGSGEGQFQGGNGPLGLSFGLDNKTLYIADYGNNRVHIYNTCE